MDTLNSSWGRGWRRINSFLTHNVSDGSFCDQLWPNRFGRHDSPGLRTALPRVRRRPGRDADGLLGRPAAGQLLGVGEPHPQRPRLLRHPRLGADAVRLQTYADTMAAEQRALVGSNATAAGTPGSGSYAGPVNRAALAAAVCLALAGCSSGSSATSAAPPASSPPATSPPPSSEQPPPRAARAARPPGRATPDRRLPGHHPAGHAADPAAHRRDRRRRPVRPQHRHARPRCAR